MSKAKLKKELDTFTSEQLVEVILNAYDSSKEAKAYFEFFLNPDPEKLYNSKVDIIAKELNRTKRGYCRARISYIRAAIRDFEAYGMGAEMVSRLMYDALCMLTGVYANTRYPDTLINGTIKLARDYIIYADRNSMAADALANINKLSKSNLGTPRFRSIILRSAMDAVDELKK